MTTPCRKFVSRNRFLSLFAFLSVLGTSGCNAAVIEGTVVDIKGEPLPGVAVTIAGHNRQALTNALGVYKLTVNPGTYMFSFDKSGYTPGRFEIEVSTQKKITARTVTLWCLPPGNGVFLYDNYRYRATRAVERETFLAQDGRLLYGTIKFDPDHPDSISTKNNQPVLLCYNMPRSGVFLHRLERSEIILEDSRTGTAVRIWLPVESLPAELLAIDEPEGLLQQVHFDHPLKPGVYAVNWGAFEGAAGNDPRMYIFSVLANTHNTPTENASPETQQAPTNAVPSRQNTPKAESPQKEANPKPKNETPKNKKADELDLVEPVLHEL